MFRKQNTPTQTQTQKILCQKLAMNSHPEAIRLIDENWGDTTTAWRELSENPCFAAIDLVEREFHRVNYWLDWSALSMEPLAISLLERNKTHIDWKYISANPAAMHLLERNPDTINWSFLSHNTNPMAIQMLETNLDKIDWYALSSNHSPYAMQLLEAHPDKIDWNSLSANTEATRLLEKNQDKIVWSGLMRNSSPFAARLLEENQDKIDDWNILNTNINPDVINMLYHVNPLAIDWRILSENPAAIHLLEANPHNICWMYINYDYDNEYSVWCNPAIFDDEPVLK